MNTYSDAEIVTALYRYDNSVSQAAMYLGCTTKTIYRRLKTSLEVRRAYEGWQIVGDMVWRINPYRNDPETLTPGMAEPLGTIQQAMKLPLQKGKVRDAKYWKEVKRLHKAEKRVSELPGRFYQPLQKKSRQYRIDTEIPVRSFEDSTYQPGSRIKAVAEWVFLGTACLLMLAGIHQLDVWLLQ